MINSFEKTVSPTRPFLKWPGGKFRLLNRLQPHIPQTTYLVEPFVGAGALFLNASNPKIIVNDANHDLINFYQQLKRAPAALMKEAGVFFSSQYNLPDTYYALRAEFNASRDPKTRAALFLYLNRHGYNGLCRYNAKGCYNVPFGRYKKPYFPETEMAYFAKISHKTEFYSLDFAVFLNRFLKRRRLDDYTFYCDPPYAPISKTSTFTHYTPLPFQLTHQALLADMARALSQKGATVIISNHDLPFTRKLYRGARIKKLSVLRSISCKGKNRKKAAELLAIYRP